jgi:hypothetical protein
MSTGAFRVAVRWDGRYEELDLGSRFEFLSPFYDGTHGWEGGARESGAPRSLTPAGNLIVAGGSELRVSDRVV